MSFFLLRKTTAKVLIPEGVLKDAELQFYRQIVNYVEKYQIPPLLIMNFDQTPSKYLQISSNTIEKKGKKNVLMSGIDYKISITTTFSITMKNRFLLKVQFPNGFSFSTNLKHYSNEMESLKFLKEIILRYVKIKQEGWDLKHNQLLLIYDVF